MKTKIELLLLLRDQLNQTFGTSYSFERYSEQIGTTSGASEQPKKFYNFTLLKP